MKEVIHIPPNAVMGPEMIDPEQRNRGEYERFLEAKVLKIPDTGFAIDDSEINPILKPHQKAIVKWAVKRGRAAIFAAFGLGKTVMQLEMLRLICQKNGGRGLIVCPLGVRFEFAHDAGMLGIPIRFVRSIEECEPEGIYITNYETVREEKLDPRQFAAISLDEAACLRGLGGTKTFRKLMGYFEGSGKYRIVATATPSPNDYIELLAYSAFLDMMDVSGAKTRFFKRDSEHADELRLMPHKEQEFWLWCSSWAVFLQSPADLGFSDDGYSLPPMTVRWHEIPSDHSDAGQEPNGQGRLLSNSAIGVTHAAREKRRSLGARIEMIRDLVEQTDRTLYGFEQFIVWCDLNDEQQAVDALLKEMGITYSSLYGADGIERREHWMAQWRAKETVAFVSKPSMYGAGVNLQQARHAIFPGVGYKFYAFIQAIHRINRFLQERKVIIDIIYTETEREIRRALEAKWEKHKELIANMTKIIQKYGLGSNVLAEQSQRQISIFRQPGRVAAIHVKDRITPSGLTGMGFQTVQPFSDECTAAFTKHGFGFLARKTIVTDVVRENNQTYRLGWTEQCKDGSRMGAGMPEYLLLFRKPPTDTSNGYADVPVVKSKAEYTRSRWQIDAHGFMRSNGNRAIIPSDLVGIPHDRIFKLFRQDSMRNVYDFERHVELSESLERCQECGHIHIGDRKCGQCDCKIAGSRLPATFMLLQPQSWHEDVWTDIARMRTLNSSQVAAGREMHICPLQFDIVDRVITQFSMKGETVYDPFSGLGTVVQRALLLKRRGLGVELSEDYFADGCLYMKHAEVQQSMPTLFDLIDGETLANQPDSQTLPS